MSTPVPTATPRVRIRDAGLVALAQRGSVWIGAGVLLMALPHLVRSPVAISVMNQMGIAVVFALSYNMLLGQGGMLSFGHAVYFGLGGFVAIHLLNLLHVPVALLPIVGALGGLGFAALFGSFSTNRAGTVFAMISLGIGELIHSSSLIFVKFFGGEEGITGNRTKAPPFLGLSFTTDAQVYYLIVFWAFVATVLMYAYSRTPMGRIANAVRDNPERAEFIGYSQRWARYVSFCAAGLVAGLAGGLFAVNYEILTVENVSLQASGSVLLMTFIGGVGFFFGPILGAIAFTFLQSMLSDYTAVWLLYLGVLFLATVLFVPMGLAGILVMHRPAARSGRLHHLLGPYALAAVCALIAVVGVVGLVEMVQFLVSGPAGQSAKRLFGVRVPVYAVWPWLVLVALTAVGALGLRRTGPGAAAAFAEASRPLAPPARGSTRTSGA
ncbi:MAG TPA: branched-chain amino acid ABC transporter permease [Methylomirabilota bacterium]